MKIASESDANGSYISAFNANLTDYSDADLNMFVCSFALFSKRSLYVSRVSNNFSAVNQC